MPTSRHFGQIDPDCDYAAISIPLGPDTVRAAINLAIPASFSQPELDAVDRNLDELARHDAAARAAFAAVLDNDRFEPARFLRFHHDEVEGYESLTNESFVAALRLERISLYPDGAFGTDSYLALDYALRGPPTDQLLVAKFLRDGSLLTIAWES
jgi:Protein of unknown function (DUF2004)